MSAFFFQMQFTTFYIINKVYFFNAYIIITNAILLFICDVLQIVRKYISTMNFQYINVRFET